MSKNPYAITFGRIPNQYISRDILIDTIIETLVSDIVEEQAFKLTGVRGAGKTVTLTAIEKKLRGPSTIPSCAIASVMLT